MCAFDVASHGLFIKGRVMKKITFVVVVFTALAGCSLKLAQNPDEFREYVKVSDSARVVHESYEVSSSLSTITKRLQDKSKECLPYRFVRQFSYKMGAATGANTSYITYAPTLKKAEGRTEFYMQVDVTGDVTVLGNPPEGGTYVLVADIAKITKNSSQVDIYHASHNDRAVLPKTIKKWIAGDEKDCPDLKVDMESNF